MATGPIETHLHRSFNWENAAPGSRIGPRGRSASCGNGLFAQCVRLRSEINPPYKIAEFEHLGADKTRTVETVRYAFKPTNSRPTEVRIAQINKLNFFLDLPDIAEGDGMLFMAFIRKSSGLSQAQYLTEKQISHPRSNKIIAAAMYEAIEEKHGNDAVVFSVDLV